MAFKFLFIYCFILTSCSHFQWGKARLHRSLASKAGSKSCYEISRDLISKNFYEPKVQQSIADALKKLFELVEIDPQLIAGARSPTWEEVEQLRKIVSQLEKTEKEYKHLFVGEFLAQNISETGRGELQRLKEKIKLFSLAKNPPASEFELIYFYQSLFLRIESFLPFKMGIKTLDLGPYTQEINNQALQIVGDLEKKLFKTTGFKDLKEYREALLRKGDPELMKFNDMVRDEKFEVAMNRPIKARWWIPKTGFHNQHATGSTEGGVLAAQEMNRAEASLAQFKSYDQYSKLGNGVKPKYGYLRTPLSDKSYFPNFAFYGSDTYIFDLSKIRQRLTWTPGDSFMRFINYSKRSLSKGISLHEPQSWDEGFMPWSERELLSALLYYHYKEDSMILPAPSFNETLLQLKYSLNNTLSNFVEMQIWGTLGLEDVKEFIFRTGEPSGEFLEQLRSHKIKIFDGRRDPPIEWNPSST